MSNTLIFVGRLGKDAERKSITNGSILKFSVGENVGFGDKQTTNWWNCTVFGKQAESGLIDYLAKGAQVQIVGEVKFREYEGKTYNDVSVSRVELIGSKSSGGNGSNNSNGGGYAKPQEAKKNDDDDGLPF